MHCITKVLRSLEGFIIESVGMDLVRIRLSFMFGFGFVCLSVRGPGWLLGGVCGGEWIFRF